MFLIIIKYQAQISGTVNRLIKCVIIIDRLEGLDRERKEKIGYVQSS